MNREEIIRCKICERILSIGNTKIAKKNGITWEFGYSKGGWGSRESKPNFTGEVCDECFDIFIKKSEEFNKELLFKRRCINKQEVKIA
jgi:hypothetical protein